MDKDKKSSEPNVKSGGSDRQGSSGRFGFDTDEAKRLHAMGMRDIELATQFGVDRSTIVDWRKENGLMANRIAVWNEEKARELHAKGASDIEIAAELSKAGGNVSSQAVGRWRKKNGLGTNPRYSWTRLTSPDSADATTPGSADQTPDIEGGVRRGHLVALPSRQPEQDSEPRIPSGYAPRGMHQRKRSRADLPLPSVYNQEMGGGSIFEEFSDLAGGDGPFREEDALYVFATILHLCRMEFGWDGDDVTEFIDAAAFAEQIMMNVSFQTGAMSEDGEDYEFDPEEFFSLLDVDLAPPVKNKPKDKPAKQPKKKAKNTKGTKNTNNTKK